MRTNIVLTGFMGAGKTGIGRTLARELSMAFFDTDRDIEEATGMTIPAIFRRYGEKRFRSEERLAVSRACRCRDTVISTGGGVVLDPRNMEDLRNTGLIVNLGADPDVLYDRVRNSRDRPLLQGASRAEFRERFLQRQPLYAEADLVFDTTRLGIPETVARLAALCREMQACERGKTDAD